VPDSPRGGAYPLATGTLFDSRFDLHRFHGGDCEAERRVLETARDLFAGCTDCGGFREAETQARLAQGWINVVIGCEDVRPGGSLDEFDRTLDELERLASGGSPLPESTIERLDEKVLRHITRVITDHPLLARRMKRVDDLVRQGGTGPGTLR
jgi:hypothetical protein